MICTALALLGAAALPGLAAAAHEEDAAMPAAAPEAAMAPIPVEPGECRGEGANPGRYHFSIGSYYAAVINDGEFGPFPIDQAPYLNDPYITQKAVDAAFLDGLSVGRNILYLDTGDDQILFDTGLGAAAGGMLMSELQAMGVMPEDITKVMLTHGHPDHVNGLLMDPTDGESGLSFPNAQVYVSRKEWEYWTADSPDMRNFPMGEESFQEQVATAQRVFGAVNGSVTLFDFGEDIIPGVVGTNAPWHTPGMTVYTLSLVDGEPPVVVTGDAFNTILLSIENPWFISGFDSLPEEGPAGRYKLLDSVIGNKPLMNVYHGAFPALGKVSGDGTGVQYRWHGVNYASKGGVLTTCEGM